MRSFTSTFHLENLSMIYFELSSSNDMTTILMFMYRVRVSKRQEKVLEGHHQR